MLDKLKGSALGFMLVAALVVAIMQIILPTFWDILTDPIYWILLYAAYQAGKHSS